MRYNHLFCNGPFKSHSGLELDWKIDCDALVFEDFTTLAALVGRHFRFGKVVGIPTGGLDFAEALQSYVTEGPTLIVDDVLTTGHSMEAYHQSPDDIGVVIFARGPYPSWIYPIFVCGDWLHVK